MVGIPRRRASARRRESGGSWQSLHGEPEMSRQEMTLREVSSARISIPGLVDGPSPFISGLGNERQGKVALLISGWEE